MIKIQFAIKKYSCPANIKKLYFIINYLYKYSCNKPTIQTSEKDFWTFQATQILLAVISLCVIQYKKKQFHKKLMKRIQKQLDSVV